MSTSAAPSSPSKKAPPASARSTTRSRHGGSEGRAKVSPHALFRLRLAPRHVRIDSGENRTLGVSNAWPIELLAYRTLGLSNLPENNRKKGRSDWLWSW